MEKPTGILEKPATIFLVVTKLAGSSRRHHAENLNKISSASMRLDRFPL
jgi:hypothetical protein